MATIQELVNESGVGVWHYPSQQFVFFVPCPGETRVRVDAYDSLENYAVYPGVYNNGMFFPKQPAKPLNGWRIDYT